MVTVSKPTGPDADPRLPDLHIEFGPTAPLHLAQVSTQRRGSSIRTGPRVVLTLDWNGSAAPVVEPLGAQLGPWVGS